MASAHPQHRLPPPERVAISLPLDPPRFPSPLLLIVHGRAAGVIPGELLALAADLEERRGRPVRIQALTAEASAPSRDAAWLTLVPLFLLPGNHVRVDVPGIADTWRAHGPVRRLPFLGAWPVWQRALAEELATLAGDTAPLLLHHPLADGLGARYLAHLQSVTGARLLPTPYTAADLREINLAIHPRALPLTLAANRLTDSLPAPLGVPLLARPRFRELLLRELEALP